VITVYLKPTNYCNVGCDHCYLTEDVRADKTKMTFSTLSRTGEMLGQMQERANHDHTHIIWHGGEPMILSPDWIWQAGDILESMIPGHTESIQTSLIPYAKEWAPLIRERFANEVGSSMDFTSRAIRGDPDAYQRLWMKKVDLAREDDIAVLPGVVPSTREIDRAPEIINWFMERDFNMFNFERYNKFGQDLPDWPTNAEHSRFLIGLFDELMRLLQKNGEAPIVQIISTGIGGVLHDTPGDRWGGTCQSDFVVVEPDGSTNNCPDKASFEGGYSSVYDGYDGFSKSSLRRKWIRVQTIDHKKNHCHTCENNSWCKSACPITPNGPSDGESECAGYKMFLDHVRSFASSSEGRALTDKYLADCNRPYEEDPKKVVIKS